MADQEYCLRWNNHQTTLTAIFDKLLQASRYTDCTISAGGQNVAAHKLLLTACSPYFDSLFSGIRDDRHAVIVLSDVTYAELRALMDYMYRGEVNISQDRLAGLLKVAEALQIRGLYEPGESQTRAPPPAPVPPPVAPSNRPSGLTIERTRRSVPNVSMDFPQDVSRDDASRSPVPKRRKRPTRSADDFAPLLGTDPLNETDTAPAPNAGPLPAVDKILPDGAPLLPDPPKLEREPAFEAIQPKEEFLDDQDNSIENITLDDDDDDGMDDMDQSQQPGTSHMGEGSSSQGYPPSWHNSEQSNDEIFMAAQQAVGDGTQREGTAGFQCFHCPRRYKHRKHLLRHFRQCGLDPFLQCPLCPYRAEQKLTMLSHMKQIHNQDTFEEISPNVYVCSKCDNGFSSIVHLTSHQRHHCVEAPRFQCPFCPRGNMKMRFLRVHMCAMHRDKKWFMPK